MKQYETYKDSSIPSIGTIPNSWRVVPIKYVLEQSANGIKIGPFGSTLTGKVSPDNQVKVYGQWNVIGKDFSAGKNYVSEDTYQELESYWIHPNDILISMMGTVGKCAIIPKGVAKGIMDSHIVKVRLDETIILPQFFYYVDDKDGSNVVISQIQRDRRGSIMDGLNSTLIKSFIIPLPPLSEQQDIVYFLDEKVNMIDATIAEKEQMLEDLKAYRSAIISEAVTKGLDKNVEMKDSGIEWCGYIPIHWQVLKIGYIFQNLDYLRQPISSENRERNNPQYEYYGASGVIDKIDSYNVNDKVLLIGEDGANLVSRTLPLIYKAEGKFWVNNHAHILKPISSDYDYMAFLLETADYTNYITGSAQPKLSQEKLSSVKLPVPPIEEQKQIAKKLICIVPLIDKSLIEIEKIIKDLKSYKSSLITEAVTGKIDLRDWKPKEEKV